MIPLLVYRLCFQLFDGHYIDFYIVCFAEPCFGESIDSGAHVTAVNGYSGGIVAVITILCSFVSLFIGFVVGVLVRWRRRFFPSPTVAKSKFYSASLDKDLARCSGTKENFYDSEPVKSTFQSFGKVRKPEVPPFKAHNVSVPLPFYVNDLKKDNSMKVANSAVNTTLQPPPRRHRTTIHHL